MRWSDCGLANCSSNQVAYEIVESRSISADVGPIVAWARKRDASVLVGASTTVAGVEPPGPAPGPGAAPGPASVTSLPPPPHAATSAISADASALRPTSTI